MNELPRPEPWLRGTLTEIPAVLRAVVHALELAREDLAKWTGSLTDRQLEARPMELASVAFQLRHIAGSLDRLLTYAEGQALASAQTAALRAERSEGRSGAELRADLEAAITRSIARVRAMAGQDLEARRSVGARALPTTLGGLLVHVADHTQRHVGQAIVTAKLAARL